MCVYECVCVCVIVGVLVMWEKLSKHWKCAIPVVCVKTGKGM